ncbi:unnamed protein product [Closterium sp. NIES-65]|nr:unnamed protein product [Closterium sp. NIES-65]
MPELTSSSVSHSRLSPLLHPSSHLHRSLSPHYVVRNRNRRGAAAAGLRTEQGREGEESGSAVDGAHADDQSALAHAHDLPPKVHLWQHHESLSSRHLSDSLSSVHHYFDYRCPGGQEGTIPKSSAGMAAVGGRAASDWWAGRFQAGLLVEGGMHARYGHVQHAMGVRVGLWCMQHAAFHAICHLQSQTATSAAPRQLAVLGAPNSLQQPTLLEGGVWRGGGRSGGKKGGVGGEGIVGGEKGAHGGVGGEGGGGAAVAGGVQQQVCVLLQRCLVRAAQLRLPRLVFAIQLLLTRYTVEHATDGRALHTTTSLSLPPSDVNPSPLLVCQPCY